MRLKLIFPPVYETEPFEHEKVGSKRRKSQIENIEKRIKELRNLRMLRNIYKNVKDCFKFL